MAPPSLQFDSYLRSTWVLKHGKWHCVESHKKPQGSQPINERALFQFHPLPNTVPAPPATPDGQLILFLSPLSDLKPHRHHIHSLSTRPQQVINALTRIAHGGRGDSYAELFHQIETADGNGYDGFRKNYEDNQPSRLSLLVATEVPEDYWERISKIARRLHNAPTTIISTPRSS